MSMMNQKYTVIFSVINNRFCGQIFVCDQADNEEHAREQAENAYPGCVIHCVFKPDAPGWLRIYSPNNGAINGAGFWSSVHGWVEVDDRESLFDVAEVEVRVLPVSVGNDAVWQFVTESEASQFSISDKIKGEYLNSGCQSSDVDHAIERLIALCPDLFATPDHAWSFLMEEPHENLEHGEVEA